MAQKRISITEKKNSKADLDPQKDQFIDKAMAVFNWAYDHRRLVALVLASALVISIAAIMAHHLMDSAREDASLVLSKGLDAASASIIPKGSDNEMPGLSPSKNLTFETTKARATEMLKNYENAIAQNDSSTEVVAILGKAAAEYDLGEYTTAANDYKKVLSSKESSLPWLRQVAKEGLAFCLEAQGQIDEALKHFEELMKEQDTKVSDAANYNAGRLYARKGNNEKAIELFKKIVDSYAKSGDFSRFDYLFVQARENLLALKPDAEVPALPETIDPRLLRQLMQARARSGQS